MYSDNTSCSHKEPKPVLWPKQIHLHIPAQFVCFSLHRFPGSIWHLYNLTEDEEWKTLAVKYTEALDSAQYLTWHHDVGFMIGCSFLNGMRVGGMDYRSVIVQAAKSLSTRFRGKAGVFQSWDADKGWQAKRGSSYNTADAEANQEMVDILRRRKKVKRKRGVGF